MALAAGVGLTACGKKETAPETTAGVAVVNSEQKVGNVEQPNTIKVPWDVVAPSYALSNAYPNTQFTPPKVYFYDDPKDPTRRCQAVTHDQGIATTCWKQELR
jgi:hypothetical protein